MAKAKNKRVASRVTLEDYRFKQINLLPVSKTEQKKQSRTRVLLSLLVLIITTSLTASIFMLDDYRQTKKNELTLIQQRLMILEQKTVNNEVVDAINQIISKKTKTIQALSDVYSQTSYQIKQIKALTPQGIVFKQLSKSDGNQYLLSGTTDDPKRVADFIFALRTSEAFSGAFLQNITNQSGETDAKGSDFAILLQVKEGSHEAQ